MHPNALPVQLRHCPQWVCWASKTRDGKATKVPLNPSTGSFASTAESDTWGTFDDALAHARRPEVAGIGFVFTSTDPYVGVDLDDCRESKTGTLTDDAITILTRLHSYTEISPSGTGLHVIARGTLPDGQRRRGSVEMYDEGRFFTMTGNRLEATPERVKERPEALQTVHDEFVAPSTTAQEQNEHESVSDQKERQLTFESQLDDDEVIEKARSASNGQKFSRLWDGNTGGYESHSEADMALCCLLAFWTDSDPSRVDKLFRRSGLMREKWDEVHYSDGTTYGERTIERACKRVSDTYSTR